MLIEWKGVNFELDDRAEGSAYFIMGVRKSGSSMFNRVAQLLARYNNVNWVDVAGSLFNKNIKVGEWVRDPSFAEIIRLVDGPLALTPCVSRTAFRRCEDCRDVATCALRGMK